jgi:hypothetical protein
MKAGSCFCVIPAKAGIQKRKAKKSKEKKSKTKQSKAKQSKYGSPIKPSGMTKQDPLGKQQEPRL